MNTLETRLSIIQAKLKKSPYDALLIEDPLHLFYLTGLPLSTGHALITQEQAFLFVTGIYQEAASSLSHVKTLPFGKEYKHLKQVPLANKQVAVLAEKMSLLQYNTLVKLGEFQVVPAPHFLSSLRQIKEKKEIQAIQKACQLTLKSYHYLVSLLVPGVTEIELQNKLLIFFLNHGALSAFDPIIAFGVNSSKPHHRPSEHRLQAKDVVQFDFGAKIEGYCSDMSRVVLFNTNEAILCQHHNRVEEAKQAAIEKCWPKETLQEVDHAARAVLEKHQLLPYFSHSLGHGIGLEVHEAPFFRNVQEEPLILEAGMVLTIEPGIYFPQKYGMRIEETLLITNQGPKILTC